MESNTPTASNATISEYNNIVEKLSIPHVWQNLAHFLNLSDLKALRLSCKTINNLILNSTNFKSRSIVNILEDRVKPDVFGKTKNLWTNFMIPFERKNATDYNQNESFDWFYPMLISMQSLTLIGNDSQSCEKIQQDLSLEKLLEAAEQLQILKVTMNIFWLPETLIALKNLSLKGKLNLENLTQLHLMSRRHPSCDMIFEESTKLLVPLLKNLKSIVIDCMAASPDEVDIDTVKPIAEEGEKNKINQSLINIILNNKEHLTKLHIHDIHMWTKSPEKIRIKKSLKSILDCGIIFPRLKSLLIVAADYKIDDIMKFLERQPFLEEIDLTIYHKFTSQLFDTIRKKGKMLKRLTIRTKNIDGFDERKWIFLNDLKALEDLKVDFTNSNAENCGGTVARDVLTNLPNTIKKISLKSQLVIHRDYLKAEDFVRINPNILTHFTINICNSIRDETLHFIWEHFRNLQLLDVCGSTAKCTDYGFTGISSCNSQHTKSSSINNLQGLRTFSFWLGYHPTKKTLEWICIRDLKNLNLHKNVQWGDFNADVTSKLVEGLKVLIKNNKCLEVVRTKTPPKEVDFPTIEELRELNPRIIRHIVKKPGSLEYDTSESDELHASLRGLGVSVISSGLDDYF